MDQGGAYSSSKIFAQLIIFHETDWSCRRFAAENVAFATAKIGFEKVADYRLYCLDGACKVASAQWVEADDDRAAIEAAQERHNGYACELWQGRRLVARLDFRSI
jgi:hypothetical protein